MPTTLISTEYIPMMTSFVFVFAVVYGLLIYTKFLGGKNNTNIIISLVFAFLAASYEPFVAMLYQYMPIATILLIAAFVLVFLSEVGKKLTAGAKTGQMIVVIGLLLLILGSAWGHVSGLLPYDSQDVLWGVGILLVLMMFWLSSNSGE